MNGAPVALDDDIVLKDFLPKNYETCFSYFGSSTMPRCEEIVTLCVVNGTSTISLSQASTYHVQIFKQRNVFFFNFSILL